MPHTLLLCPLYNDEDSFHLFAARVKEVAGALPGRQLSILVVNDGSGPLNLQSELPLSILHLYRNIGHQKALAIGMAYAAANLPFDALLVMDGDGEDRPEDIPRMLEAGSQQGRLVVASRTERKEGRRFRLFYRLYKAFFYLLTGKKISFGNFMYIPKAEVQRLVHLPEIWNHLAGAVIKSKTPYAKLATPRGSRYAGRSKMNFTALLLHGLGAIGVFIDVIASRLLLFSLGMIGLSLVAIAAIVGIKLFTSAAVPGWATSTISSMLIILLQSCLLSLFTIFLYLSSQGQRKFIPALHYADYVQSFETRIHG